MPRSTSLLVAAIGVPLLLAACGDTADSSTRPGWRLRPWWT